VSSETLDSIPVITDDDTSGRGRERVARLRSSVSSLRTRTTSRSLDFYLFLAGAVLVPLGLLIILLGWYGASHTGYLFEQIPYVISGGLLGVGLVVVGSFAYFAYWLTRIFHQQREQADRTVALLERLELRLGELPESLGDRRPTRGNGTAAASFVATATGSMFHRPDCAVVANRPKLRKVRGDERDMEPCKLCDPLGDDE
jgi:hypothetical protein